MPRHMTSRRSGQTILTCIFGALIWIWPWFTAQSAYPYLEREGRLEFAQLYLGFDVLQPASLQVRDEHGEETELTLPSIPRFTIGGLHFWGWGDFYVTFPLPTEAETPPSRTTYRATYRNGVETGFRIYPLRVRSGRLSPFAGLAWIVRGIAFESERGPGPDLRLSQTSHQLGLLWGTDYGLWELGHQSYAQNRAIGYPLDRQLQGRLRLPQQAWWIGYKWLHDTTLSAADPQRRPDLRQSAWFVGLGPSSATLSRRSDDSSYLAARRPFLDPGGTDVFLEFNLGHEFRPRPWGVNLSARQMQFERHAYGVQHQARRRALSLEGYYLLGDWVGFVPFIGPVLSYDQLSLRESDTQAEHTLRRSHTGWHPGLLLGWDIRPRYHTPWLLRTNLRYFPRLDLPIEDGRTLSFAQLEFNFINFIHYFR